MHLEDGTIKTIDEVKYIEYIATRPGVQLSDNRQHGLFTLNGDADMVTEKASLKEHDKSIKWSQIISFTREDAVRTGFDNRQAFQNLIRAKADDIAKLYNISLNNLVVNAAFHDKDFHPHVHLVFYSIDSREGFVPDMKKASEKFKSLIFNEVFKDDVSQLKELKTEQRKDFDIKLEASLKRLYSKDYIPPSKLPGMLNDLSENLKGITGKKVYGYLPPEIKQQVCEILNYAVSVDKQLPGIFEAYCETQKTFISQYIDDAEKISGRVNDFKTALLYPGKNDPKTLHNIIIKYASALSIEPPIENGTTIQKESDDSEAVIDFGLPSAKNGTTVQKENDGSEPVSDSGYNDSEFDFGEPPPENTNYPPDNILEFGYSAQDNDANLSLAENGRTVQKEKGDDNLWTDEYKKARAYLYGQNFEQNFGESYRLMKQEAEKNNPLALYDVGFMHLNGLYVEMDSAEAQKWFTKSYDAFRQNEEKKNNAYLEYRIGKLHRSGYGVDQSDSSAAGWFEKSSNKGNQYAQYSLGSLYCAGKGVVQDYEMALILYKQSASKGNVFANYELGRMYESGTGVSIDKKAANDFYCIAYTGFEALEAETHDDKLQYRLGKMNISGNGTAVNEIKAAEYFEKASKLGNANAQYSLAKLWLSKEEYSDKVNQALEWLDKSADQDNQFAQYTLGKLYLKEERKNVFYALHYLKASATQGNQFAQYALGKLYLGKNDVKKDMVKALENLTASADQGNQFAQYSLGKLYLVGEDMPKDIYKAVAYLTQSADQSNQFAQYSLGKLYLVGEDVTKDIDKAIDFLWKSAAQNNQFAQFALGRVFLNGEDAEKNILIAEYWLDKSADQGNQFAQYSLGKLYLVGEDVPKDTMKALNYLTQSADQGNQFAQYTLGKAYFKGEDVLKDKDQAIYYLSQSANQGNEYAQKLLEYISGGSKRDAAYVATLVMRELAYAISRDTKQENGYYNNSRASAFHMSQVRRKFTLKRKRQPQRNIADDISF